MLVAKVENNQVLDIADYTAMFPDTSFGSNGPNASFMDENNLLPVSVWVPYDQATEKLVATTPYIQDGMVYTVKAEPLTPEELQQRTDAQAAAVRKQRDVLLYQCDWTQLPDAPVDSAEWAVYRQQLRDVTNQPGFPWEVVWPTEPGYIQPDPFVVSNTVAEPDNVGTTIVIDGGAGNDTI